MNVVKGLAAAALMLGATPGMAQDWGTIDATAKTFGISELRGGLAIDDVEMYPHAPIWMVPRVDTIKLENLDTASFDVLFRTPDLDVFKWMGSPRPVVGLDLNFKHESMVHASLNWHLPVFKTGAFVEAEFGGAVHNGALSGAVAPMRNLGCRALFYWSINVGYQINDNLNIMATEQHASQDGICSWELNQGINYEGIRLGYKF